MEPLLVVAGMFVLGMTWWDYRREEADTLLLFDWMWWWEFRRSEYPAIFWLLILGQACVGAGLILGGLLSH